MTKILPVIHPTLPQHSQTRSWRVKLTTRHVPHLFQLASLPALSLLLSVSLCASGPFKGTRYLLLIPKQLFLLISADPRPLKFRMWQMKRETPAPGKPSLISSFCKSGTKSSHRDGAICKQTPGLEPNTDLIPASVLLCYASALHLPTHLHLQGLHMCLCCVYMHTHTCAGMHAHMCVCVCLPMHTHMEARSWCQDVFPNHFPPCFLMKPVRLSFWLDRPMSPRSHLSLPLVL